MAIKNIIFDLGGVLLNLDQGKTDAAFDALVGDQSKHKARLEQLNKEGIFQQLEIGAIHEDAFLQRLQETNSCPVRIEQLRRAWNVMLLDFPPQRLEMLQSLRKEGLNIYLLSNTNSIHLTDFYKIIENELGLDAEDFDAQFNKVYYSHLIGRRKPDASIFSYVVEDANLDVKETLFIDDTPENVISAKSIGLHAIYHERNSDIVGAVGEYLQID